jgi:hypothetical protein
MSTENGHDIFLDATHIFTTKFSGANRRVNAELKTDVSETKLVSGSLTLMIETYEVSETLVF